MFSARRVWVDQEIANIIGLNALQILAQASRIKLRFFAGKRPRCILGGLFYLLGFRFRAVKTQKEIADRLCISDVSVRKSYNNWLNEFPQYFTDVKNKLPRT
jgi:transcription initiation factor TFIIIB Brf1 subunit/transcription initiation factor TFIIB